MEGMAHPTYDVFIQRDGNYGVALSLRGAMVSTAPDFADESDARAWVAQDRLLGGPYPRSAAPDPALPITH